MKISVLFRKKISLKNGGGSIPIAPAGSGAAAPRLAAGRGRHRRHVAAVHTRRCLESRMRARSRGGPLPGVEPRRTAARGRTRGAEEDRRLEDAHTESNARTGVLGVESWLRERGMKG
jgi:hypothetical protein